MKKICDTFTKVILIVFIGIFVWTISNAILDYDIIVYEFNPIILSLIISIYIVSIVFFYKKILPKLENIKNLPIILICIFSLLCLFIAYDLRLNPAWDMGIVYNIADTYVRSGTFDNIYLYEYPHNILLTTIYIVLFKIFSFIPNVNNIILVTFFNSFVVISMVVFTYLVAKKMLGNKKALLFLIIAIFTSPLYLHAAIYYSDAISALFAIMTLYFYLKVQESETLKNKVIYEILLGIALFIGLKIKITASFVIIAVIVCNILNLKIKSLVKDLAITILVFLVLLVIFQVFVSTKVISNKDAIKEYKMPIEHWIMMGLKGNGCYDSEDYAYTKANETYNKRKEADRKEIKRRLDEYDASSFIKHLTEKLKFTWSDGTYFAPVKLSISAIDKGPSYEFIAGRYQNLYKYIPQTMHISMLIFIVINGIDILKNKKYSSKDMILLIAMFGITIFLLIWENRSRYILTLVPIMMILQINGIEVLADKIKKEIG